MKLRSFRIPSNNIKYNRVTQTSKKIPVRQNNKDIEEISWRLYQNIERSLMVIDQYDYYSKNDHST